MDSRQIDFDRGALSDLAVNLHMAARLLDEAIHHGDAEARTLAFRLGTEEGLEHLLDQFGRDAGAGIRHGDHHVLAWADLAVLLLIVVVEMRVAKVDRYLADAIHRIARVDRVIEVRIL